MAIRYCEFVPPQHRNKVVGNLVFLDHPGDKHPLAICQACAAKLMKMRPDSIVLDPKKEAAEKAAAEREKAKTEKAAAKAAKAAEDERLAEEQRAAEAASAAEEAEEAGEEDEAEVPDGDADRPAEDEPEGKPEPAHGA